MLQISHLILSAVETVANVSQWETKKGAKLKCEVLCQSDGSTEKCSNVSVT